MGRFLKGSWKTGVIGVIAVACGSAELLELLPAQYAALAPAVCSILMGLGLVAAKDADKTNAVNATPEPQKVG